MKKQEAIHLVDNLSTECDQLKTKIFQLEQENKKLKIKISELEDDPEINLKEINFGIGAIFYKTSDNSTSAINQLMDVLKNAAMSVPLYKLISSIENAPGFPRF